MLEQRRKGFYFSVLAILCISFGTGAYIYHTLSLIGKNLTDEFHESYYHAQKLELDTAKLLLIVEQFSSDPSDEKYEKLLQGLDLVFLRAGVVVDTSQQFSSSTREYSSRLEPSLKRIEAKISGGLRATYDSLDELRQALADFVLIEQDVSRRFNVHVEGAIEDANETIKDKQIQVIVILAFMMLVLICLVVIVYRKSAIASELKRSEENLRRIVDLIPHVVYVRDSEGYIELANEMASKDTGLSVEQLTGAHFLDCHPTRSVAEATLADDLRVIAHGQPRINYQDTDKNDKGDRQWFSISKVPFTRREDNRQLVLSIKMDITGQKMAELMVRNSEERLQLALEGTDLGMWDWNLQTGECHYSDRYFTMLGYEEKELEPTIDLWETLVHPEDKERVRQELDHRLSHKGSNWSIEYRLQHKNGGYRWINNYGKVVDCEDSGTPVRAAGTHLDITESVEASFERRGLESQLAQARKMEAIGTLAGGIAHDFNNILTAILGFSELARNDLKEGSRPRANLDKVLNAGNRAKDLVKNILSFSRKSTQQKAPVHMPQVIGDVIDLMRASLPSTIEILLNVDDSCGHIHADTTQIHQILMNLCTNAAHAMEDSGGTLELIVGSTSLSAKDVQAEPDIQPGIFVHIQVVDSGPGIDSSIIDRIFDPYFTTKDVGKGSGMGLAIVKGIVRSHDGFIRVDTTRGKGTVFHLFFPEIQGQAPRPEGGEILPQHGRESILIVDDEQMIVEMNKMLFSQLGYTVFATTDPVKALERFTSSPGDFDIVITDQTMPKVTGEELARQMLQIRPDLPIVLCTGYSEKMDETHCRKLGITKLISKPVDTAYLSYLVRQILDNSDNKKEL